MLTIYNSLTRKKEVFKPRQPGKVSMYVCGMTVYDYSHIGHARGMIFFDILTRYLRQQGYEVTYVRNITDIDDKIIKRANEAKQPIEIITEKFIKALQEDEQALRLIPPNKEPRATAYLAEMITMIQKLLELNYAYVASNGDVYYQVSKFKNYGQLSHKAIDKLRAGARVEIIDAKQDPLDFVLWKMAKPGEPSWPSPWGAGRPGWHIECAAMATDCLGHHFDIHGGGFDLQFPHHENEIAEAEPVTGEKFVNTWMHVGFVTVDKEKMSKSLGNFATIREVLADYAPEVLRYFMITSHYRSQINYSDESLKLAQASLQRLYTALRDLTITDAPQDSEYTQRFQIAMNDDFNTPIALSVLFDIAHEIHKFKDQDPAQAQALGALLVKLGHQLGILAEDPNAFLQHSISADEASSIEELINQRNVARAEKNWAEADRIRDQLVAMGIAIEDSNAGTTWRRQ